MSVQYGPASARVRSRTRMPTSAPSLMRRARGSLKAVAEAHDATGHGAGDPGVEQLRLRQVREIAIENRRVCAHPDDERAPLALLVHCVCRAMCVSRERLVERELLLRRPCVVVAGPPS